MIDRKCLLTILGSAAVLLALPAIATEPADPLHPGAVSVYQGSARIAASGDLVDCTEFAPVTLVLQTRLVYSALPGVCDDLGPRPCAGRLMAVMERCLGGGNSALAAGGLAGGYSRSPFRICFEPSADPMLGCSSENVVARGIWTGAGYAATAAAVLNGTASLKLGYNRRFKLDGSWVRALAQPSAQHFNLEKSQPGPEGCGTRASGCGMIGVGIY